MKRSPFACLLWILILPALTVAEPLPGSTIPGEFRGGMETTYPDWFKESFLELADDVDEAAAEGRRVIVLFHQDNCPYCNALVERNLSQQHIEAKIREHFDVVALNLRGDREVVDVEGVAYSEKALARALGVQFTPTLLFLDEQGDLVLRLNGYVPPDEFEIALDYVSQGLESEQDYPGYLAGRRPADSDGSIRTAAFASPPPYDLAAARGEDMPLAVLFEQRDCPNCETFHSAVLADPQTLALLEDFYAVQLDMWGGTAIVTPEGDTRSAREWAGDLNVKYAPTLVLFSPDGKEVIRSESFLKRFHVQSLLDYVASGAYRTETDFQRYLSLRSERIRGEGRDVDIWE